MYIYTVYIQTSGNTVECKAIKWPALILTPICELPRAQPKGHKMRSSIVQDSKHTKLENIWKYAHLVIYIYLINMHWRGISTWLWSNLSYDNAGLVPVSKGWNSGKYDSGLETDPSKPITSLPRDTGLTHLRFAWALPLKASLSDFEDDL